MSNVDPPAHTVDPSSPSDAATVVGYGNSASVGGVASVHEAPGTRIGPYTILQMVGEGGFGSVFLAEQLQPVRRKVALKIIKLGMDTRQVVARFEQERQALAILDHPNIAKVFDAGATDAGRPYFAMEFCTGEPIHSYCDRHSLSVTSRLELFAQVCDAIQHAHTKGLIHRDIKPTNVLISAHDGKPLAKVIDFGIAKATVSKLTDKTLFTEHHQLIGTPEYMSPEQAEGSLDIDTRTDVYSLGVVLYELLTGTTPLEGMTLRSAHDIPKMIREAEPPRPSTRLSAITTAARVQTPKTRGAEAAPATSLVDRRTNGHAFRRELDWVVMKAMEKDRTRRYGSAADFASDLQRYLKNEPVHAAPPGAGYRIKKFVVRHKFGVTAAAFVALALALGVAATTVSLFRAMRAEKLAVSEAGRAAREARTSDEALRFLAGLFEVVDPSEARGNTVTAREILDKGAKRIEADLAGQPESQATLMATMGTVYGSLGLYNEAGPLLQKSVALRRSLATGPDPKVAQALNDYANLLVKKAEYDTAEPLYREALDIYRVTKGEDDADSAQTLNDLASLLCLKGDFTGAEPLYRKALDVRQRLLGKENKAVADTLHDLAMNLFDQGNASDAIPLLRDSLAMRRKLFGQVHPDVSEGLNSLALVLYTRGEIEEAKPLFREALGVQKRLVGDMHPDVAMAMNNLAFVLHDNGEFDAAEATYRDVLVIQRKLLGEDHPDIAKVLNNLAAVLHDKGDQPQAEKVARDSLAMCRRVHGKEHPDIAQGLNNLARWVQDRGDLVEAELMFREALAMRRKLLTDQHPSVAESQTGLANLLVEARQFDEALTTAKEARLACVKAFPEGHWRIAVADGVEGAALSGLGRFDQAEPLLLSSFKALESEKGAAIYLADARRRLIGLYEAWNKPDSAAPYRTATKPADVSPR
ncbi:MAG: serine/threonine protein kinase [Phycisphaerales bacterium]|nr:serine/threonine protein kinase [Phycisphaerales bacterium]